MTKLEEAVAQLENPESYMNGLLVKDASIPQSVIMFERHDFVMHRNMNFHNRSMLIFALRGSGTIFVDNEFRSLNKGEATLILPFQTHYYLDTSSDYNFLFITFELPYGNFSKLENYKFNYLPHSELMTKVIKLYEEKRNIDAAIQYISMSIGLILNDLALNNAPNGNELDVDKEKMLLSQVINFIYQNFNKSITANTVSEHVALSTSHLQRCFKQGFGIPLGTFIKTVRLNNAQRLLVATKMTVSEIVYRCGYESVPSFSTAFKNYTKLSPRDYRKTYCSKEH